jgi:hypothetical protein
MTERVVHMHDNPQGSPSRIVQRRSELGTAGILGRIEAGEMPGGGDRRKEAHIQFVEQPIGGSRPYRQVKRIDRRELSILAAAPQLATNRRNRRFAASAERGGMSHLGPRVVEELLGNFAELRFGRRSHQQRQRLLAHSRLGSETAWRAQSARAGQSAAQFSAAAKAAARTAGSECLPIAAIVAPSGVAQHVKRTDRRRSRQSASQPLLGRPVRGIID